MQNLIFKALNGQFKIVATTQYITRIYDSTKKMNSKKYIYILMVVNAWVTYNLVSKVNCLSFSENVSSNDLKSYRFIRTVTNRTSKF